MNSVELPSDRIAAANLEKRRTNETQRQSRIFNEKVRTIGVDKDALDYQVNEKRMKEQVEVDSLKAMESEILRNDRTAQLLDRRERKDERTLKAAVERFRQSFQQPTNRREFDLNDPELLKKQVGDMILPGLVGEDPCSEARLRMKKEQMREWSLQQQRDLEEAREQKRLQDQEYEQSMANLNNRALELERMETKNRRALATATKDFNLLKAAETAARENLRSLQEQEDNQVEIQNQIDGDELSESYDQARSVLCSLRQAAGKIVPSRELNEIIQKQVEENKRLRAREQAEEREHDRQRVDAARTALLLERKQARDLRKQRRDLDDRNAQLAQVRRQETSNLEGVHTRGFDERFFTQFNTTSR